MQSKVELNIDGLKLPIIGYIDLECERSIRDLKTTRAIPSALPHSVNIKEIASMHYPNLDSWEWGQDDINNAKKLWSIK